MTKPQKLRVFALLWLATGLVACTGTPPEPRSGRGGRADDAAVANAPETQADSLAAADLGSDAMDPGDAEVAQPQLARITGALLDPAGAVLAQRVVTCCSETACAFATTDNTGTFVFEDQAWPRRVAIKVPEDVFASPPNGEWIAGLDLQSAAEVQLGTARLPLLPDLIPVGPAANDPQTLQLGDGLQITLRRADLTWAFGAVKEEQLGARQIANQDAGKFVDLAQEVLLGVYVVYPFATTSNSPMAVQLPTELPAGIQAKLRTISEFDGSLSAPLTLTSDGNWLRTPPGGGLDRLTWLVVSKVSAGAAP